MNTSSKVDLQPEEINDNKNINEKEKNSSPKNDTENFKKYFPLTEKVMPLKDTDLWNTLDDLTDELNVGKDHVYEQFVEIVNGVERIDLRFSALVEAGNYSLSRKDNKAFYKAANYIHELLKDKDPNFVLKGMINNLRRYCNFKDGKYTPDYSICVENYDAIILLVKVMCNIKGGDRALRNEAAEFCQFLIDYVKKNKGQEIDYEKYVPYYE